MAPHSHCSSERFKTAQHVKRRFSIKGIAKDRPSASELLVIDLQSMLGQTTIEITTRL